MKKIILLLLFIPTLSFAQSSESYKEFNFGVITNMVFDGDQIWPGASFLWGKTIYFNNNTVLDYQAGLALPTLATGKIGFGIGGSNFATIIGLRPYPATAYLQLSKNQRFNFSVEYVLDEDMFFGDGESVIFTYGIRF